ncbi:MAG: helix-turn-helix domain-containing protein [bacterium]|nr:helix-turn-helix domain-containing protein [bacterium]
MNHYITSTTIKTLREQKGYTQKQLADLLLVSDKTISKWETGKGLPDLSLIEPLAKALSVSVAELLSGECMVNRNRSANMLRSRFYVCPICGNVIFSTGEGAYSCHGVTLPPLEVEEADDTHQLTVEKIEHDYYVTMDHPMKKEHFISFYAYVTCDRVQIVKLYPEQNAETRFPIKGHGLILAYCNKDGLFKLKV